MFNKYIALLPLSAFMPIWMASRIFNGIKFYCKFTLDGSLSWQYVITLLITGALITISTWFIYLSGEFISEQILKTYQKIKYEAVRIYREIYCPIPKKISHIIENTGLISYSQSISLIKESFYGLTAKNKAINTGKLREMGGVMQKCTPWLLTLNTPYEVYKPTTEEAIELQKEFFIYDKIIQEFCSGYGYLDTKNVTIYDILYIKETMKIEKDKLNEFLRIKELEIQNITFNL
jgi:hypothetical protein